MGSTFNRRQFIASSLALSAGAALLRSPLGLATQSVSDALYYGPTPGFAKLDANENPYGPSPSALRAMAEASQQGAYYVSRSAAKLRAMIAERHGLTSDHVTLSSGSSAGLVAAAVMAGQRGDILGPDLFWDTTAKAIEDQGLGTIRRLSPRADLAIDLDALEAAIDDHIGMVHITNPNNPTGLLLSPDQLREVSIRASQRALVLVDEAYNELLDDPDGNTMIPLVKAGHRVIVARTFSKIYGLAGMRIGYLIAPPDITAEMQRFGMGWYGLNQAGIAAAIACYEDETFVQMSRARVREARELVLDGLAAAGLRALPSQTNFLFVDLGQRSAEQFRAAMAERQILIRGVYREYHHWSRVSMGRIEDVERYVGAIPEVLDQMA